MFYTMFIGKQKVTEEIGYLGQEVKEKRRDRKTQRKRQTERVR